MRSFAILPAAFAFILAVAFIAPAARAQSDAAKTSGAGPAAALIDALSAACRLNATMFANSLTADNAESFRALPPEQKNALMERLSLEDKPGRPLLSSDARNRTVLRCEAPAATTEFRFGDARVHENLAFVPVTVVDGQQTEFGFVRENGGWRLLSLGLVLFDIPKLSKQWAEEDMVAREETALKALRDLAAAVKTYSDAFGKLPETLAQLGPAPKDRISPDRANLVNAQIAAGSFGGYQYRYRIVPEVNGTDAAFELAATPAKYGESGRRSFFMDTTGKVHAADKNGAVATYEDPLLSGEKTP
ncbi:MAG: hypothetical protein ACRD4S_08790 [Candidatus Acidiferrales bacterium]